MFLCFMGCYVSLFLFLFLIGFFLMMGLWLCLLSKGKVCGGAFEFVVLAVVNVVVELLVLVFAV